MYTPAAFSEPDIAVLHRIIRENPFALIVSTGPDGPLATHLPLLLEDGGADSVIAGHMAKANPHLAALQEDKRARIIFSGPHTYISPSWYQSTEAVPTWNYVAVHAVGRVELVEDPAAVATMMSHLVDVFEAGRDAPWRMESLDAKFRDRQIKGIVGFRMIIERLEGKRKLSQNRPAADREAVARILAESPSQTDRAVAAEMTGDN